MEKQDLRSVLRLFAEIASNVRQEEGWGSSQEAEAGMPQPVVGWTSADEGHFSAERA